MKLRDYNNSTPVKRKIKSPVVKLINNEVQTSKLENQIKDLTSDNKKYQELIQQLNVFSICLNAACCALNILIYG